MNISIPGSLIYLNETESSKDSALVLKGNTFTLINPYFGTGILDARRYFDLEFQGPPDMTRNSLSRLAAFGGNMLVEVNVFADIVGCPQVHTSLI